MTQINERLGKYEIIELIGQGGMADVFRAKDTAMGRDVALKVLPPELARDPERIARFDREVRTSAGLSHPNIVVIHDVGYEDGFHYYSMELLTGGDLKQCIRTGVAPDQALTLLKEIAEALEYAHGKNIIHRDIKPENIMFDERGQSKLTDLGIAKAIGSGTRMTATGISIGTPHYMSPEQARGRMIDARSDIYSLGVVFYEMLTGDVPYSAGDTFAVAYSHINDPIPRLPSYLAEYQPLIDRMMAKHPKDRFQSASLLNQAIENLKSGQKPAHSSVETHISSKSIQYKDIPTKPGISRNIKWALGGVFFGIAYRYNYSNSQ